MTGGKTYLLLHAQIAEWKLSSATSLLTLSSSNRKTWVVTLGHLGKEGKYTKKIEIKQKRDQGTNPKSKKRNKKTTYMKLCELCVSFG